MKGKLIAISVVALALLVPLFLVFAWNLGISKTVDCEGVTVTASPQDSGGWDVYSVIGAGFLPWEGEDDLSGTVTVTWSNWHDGYWGPWQKGYDPDADENGWLIIWWHRNWVEGYWEYYSESATWSADRPYCPCDQTETYETDHVFTPGPWSEWVWDAVDERYERERIITETWSTYEVDAQDHETRCGQPTPHESTTTEYGYKEAGQCEFLTDPVYGEPVTVWDPELAAWVTTTPWVIYDALNEEIVCDSGQDVESEPDEVCQYDPQLPASDEEGCQPPPCETHRAYYIWQLHTVAFIDWYWHGGECQVLTRSDRYAPSEQVLFEQGTCDVECAPGGPFIFTDQEYENLDGGWVTVDCRGRIVSAPEWFVRYDASYAAGGPADPPPCCP